MRTIAVTVVLLGGLVLVGCGQTQVQLTIGTFVFETGQRLALELAGDDPCPCTCGTIAVAGFLVLDAQGFVIYDETSPSPLPHEQWIGVWNLVVADGSPARPGSYTAVVITSLGDFRADLRVTEPGQASPLARGQGRATVCGVGLTVYRFLSEDDGASPVFVRESEHVLVALEGNPTTGFGWEVTERPGFLMPVEGTAYRSSSELPGAGGTFFFRYEATEPGTGTLSFAYRRPWETAPPEREVGLLIGVQ